MIHCDSCTASIIIPLITGQGVARGSGSIRVTPILFLILRVIS